MSLSNLFSKGISFEDISFADLLATGLSFDEMFIIRRRQESLREMRNRIIWTDNVLDAVFRAGPKLRWDDETVWFDFQENPPRWVH